jgi:hypothetical protein
MSIIHNGLIRIVERPVGEALSDFFVKDSVPITRTHLRRRRYASASSGFISCCLAGLARGTGLEALEDLLAGAEDGLTSQAFLP